MKKLIQIFILSYFITSLLQAQSVGIGDAVFTPDKSAALEIDSKSKGLLIPRLTAQERNQIESPAQGLLVFQTTAPEGFYYFNGDEWYIINDGNNDSDTNPDNELQTISLVGNVLSISNGNSVEFQTAAIQSYQSLSLVEDTLHISQGNYVLIPGPDDMGNHIATQNIQIRDYYISNDGDDEGIRIEANGTIHMLGTVNLGANAIQANEIENNAISTSKIGDSQVTVSKLAANVPLGLSYKGDWNASTNDPNLSSGSGVSGNYYVAATPGSINLGNGVVSFAAGDWVIYNGSNWVKLNNAETSQAVQTVFGRTGDISAQSNDYTWEQIDKTASSIKDIANVSYSGDPHSTILVSNNGEWTSQTPRGAVQMNLGVFDINDNAIEYGHIQDASGAANTILYWNGASWGEGQISSLEADGDQTNELISSADLQGTTLRITDAGQTHNVNLASIQDGVFDGDSSKTNELITNAWFDNGSNHVRITDAGQEWWINLNSLASPSDRRLKENFNPTHYSLKDVLKLEVLDYDFIDGDKDQTGLIAQDLHELYPMAVIVGGEDEKAEPWKVKYELLTPLLIKATQELSEKVTSLEEANAQLADYGTKIEELETENELLKQELFHLKESILRVNELEEKLNAIINSADN